MTSPPDIGYDDRDFKVVAIGKAKPDDDVVSVLEQYLERAKAGEVRGIALIAGLRDGSHDHALVGQREPIPLLGMLTRLTHHIQTNLDAAMTIPDLPDLGG